MFRCAQHDKTFHPARQSVTLNDNLPPWHWVVTLPAGQLDKHVTPSAAKGLPAECRDVSLRSTWQNMSSCPQGSLTSMSPWAQRRVSRPNVEMFRSAQHDVACHPAWQSVTLPAGHPVGERSEGSLSKLARCFASLTRSIRHPKDAL